LEPGDPKTKVYFCLSPVAADEPLAARSGDDVKFILRIGRNGRDRRVSVEVK
jgi:hypothetical protein